MQFKGRTVIVLLLLAMAASTLATLVVADRLITGQQGNDGAATAAAAGAGGFTDKEYEKLEKIFSLIKSKYFLEVDRGEVVEGAINGMIAALNDPYTTYMKTDVAQHFTESIEGSFSGIGAEVTMQEGKVTIMAAIKDSPAQRAGLLAKDIIVSVNGESLEGLKLDEAVQKIRGPKGTKVKLEIQRVDSPQNIQLTIVRDDIDYETVYAEMLEDGIGKIEIRQFSMHTGERFIEELEALEQQGMKALVIDVRSNPGGVLPVVVSVAQPFIQKGRPIVQVEDRDGKREQTLSKGGGKDYPIAVLTNKGSASASEVLAGALREEAGAILVGEQTFGKGTVQVSYDKLFDDGSLIKMTIAKWLTPQGNWVNETGIDPDIAVDPPAYFTVARLPKTRVLEAEMFGEDVKSLQIMLEGLGYKVGRQDGFFDAATTAAVKHFQAQEGLEATGKVADADVDRLEAQIIKAILDDAGDVQLKAAVEAVREKLSQ